MGMGAFWRERGDRSNFFKDLFSINLYSFYDSYDLFFHIGMEAWDGKRLCVS